MPNENEARKVEIGDTVEYREFSSPTELAQAYVDSLKANAELRERVKELETEHGERDVFSERVEKERDDALDRAERAEAENRELRERLERPLPNQFAGDHIALNPTKYTNVYFYRKSEIDAHIAELKK